MQTQTMKLRELTIRYSVKKGGDGQAVIVGRALASPRDSAALLVLDAIVDRLADALTGDA
jgi:hypothetical protein